MTRNVGQMSNELELCIHDLDAKKLIDLGNLPIMHEINPRDVVELNVSLAKDITELNDAVANQMQRLISATEALGGSIYGGSSLLADISAIVPRRYRTTSLSESCARGFLDIASQQIVLGIGDEQLGFELYNFFRNINPALLAFTASSPYRYKNGNLENVFGVSRRAPQYELLCSRFPEDMWKNMPALKSIDDYYVHLQTISDEVNQRLANNKLDANWDELKRVRNNGEHDYSYVPFSRLEPHQIYWAIRVRPDHRNIEKGGSSVFSLELRVPDMPTTIERVQMLNTFVSGLAYYIADHGSARVPAPFNGTFDDMKAVARDGLNTKINGNDMRDIITELAIYAKKGLEERGYRSESLRLEHLIETILAEGNDADLIRKRNIKTVDDLRSYLINRLKYGET